MKINDMKEFLFLIEFTLSDYKVDYIKS